MARPEITVIGKDFYHFRSGEEDFHRNFYVKRFVGPTGEAVNLLFDPGTKLDTEILKTALSETIGGLENVHLIFLSHQDPDVTTNVNLILASAPGAYVLASIDTWRLLSMLGLPADRFFQIENRRTNTLNIKRTGHRVLPVPAFYCHFRGAMMLYDYETGILFTGDVAGGLNTRRGTGPWASEASWEGIALFHQIYMPSSRALQQTVERIAALQPFPEILAPQHGDVIRGTLVTEFLERLLKLDVGVDLVKPTDVAKDLAVTALDDFLTSLAETDPDGYTRVLAELKKPGEFTTPLYFTNDAVTDIKTAPTEALSYVWRIVNTLVRPDRLMTARMLFAMAMEKRDVPLPAELTGKKPEASPMVE